MLKTDSHVQFLHKLNLDMGRISKKSLPIARNGRKIVKTLFCEALKYAGGLEMCNGLLCGGKH